MGPPGGFLWVVKDAFKRIWSIFDSELTFYRSRGLNIEGYISEAKQVSGPQRGERSFYQALIDTIGYDPEKKRQVKPDELRREITEATEDAQSSQHSQDLAARLLYATFEGAVKSAEEAAKAKTEERDSVAAAIRALDAELHERLRGGESAGEAEKRLFLGAVASNPALVARISGARDPAGETERVLEEMRRAREAIRKGGGPGG